MLRGFMEIAVNEAVGKIAKECEEAGATKWDLVKVIKALSAEKASEDALREKALELLQEVNPRAAEVYFSFRKMKVHTSAERIEGFDRGNIIKSLLRETDVNRAIAEKIGREVENQVKDLKIKYLDTALIRAMVNTKLLEYGQEEIYRQYSRVGMPVFELRKHISESAGCPTEMLREYNWREGISGGARELHFQGSIHICAVEDFSTKLFSASWEGEEGKGEEAVIDVCENVGRLGKLLSRGPLVSAANFLVADGNLSKAKAEKVSGMLLRLARCSGSHGKPVLESALYVPDGFKGANREGAFAVAAGIESNLGQGSEDVVFSLDSKYRLKLLGGKAFSKRLDFINCRDRKNRFLGGVCTRANALSYFAGINMPKLVYESNNSEKRLFGEITKIGEALAALQERKLEIMGKGDCLAKSGLGASSAAPAVGIFGIFSAAKSFVGKGAGKDAAKFAEAIARQVRQAVGNKAAVCDFWDGDAVKRFSKINGFLGIENISRGVEDDIFLRGTSSLRKVFSGSIVAGGRKELEDRISEGFEVMHLRP